MPRKTPPSPDGGMEARIASMRPRPDAAENRRRGAHPGPAGAASMRPRPDAAENVVLSEDVLRAELASMRPRPDAAENVASRSPRIRHGNGLQ